MSAASDLPSAREAMDDWARPVAALNGIERRLHVASKAEALAGIVDDPLAECEAALARVGGNGSKPDFVPGTEGQDTAEAEPPKLQWLTGADLAALTPEEPDYVLAPYLARGLVVQLAGKVKGGKTTLAMHMAAAVLHGRAFLEES